jgi:hypothetical protein
MYKGTMLDTTHRTARNELIDAYLEWVDEMAFERYREIFATDVTFSAMGTTVEGIDSMIDWYETSLSAMNTVHDYPNRVHNEDVSIAYGDFSGDLPDGTRVEARGLDLFAFDEDTSEITKLVVYTDLQPDL